LPSVAILDQVPARTCIISYRTRRDSRCPILFRYSSWTTWQTESLFLWANQYGEKW